MTGITCTCGVRLVDEVTDEGVRPVGSDDVVRFRRNTDFVMCPGCMTAYTVAELTARADDTGVIESLERMAARQEP